MTSLLANFEKMRIYWYRGSHAIMKELRKAGFHDGFWRDIKDADRALLMALHPEMPAKGVRYWLAEWERRVVRECCAMKASVPTIWLDESHSVVSRINEYFDARLVLLSGDTTDEVIHSFNVSPFNIGIIYHVACMGNWQSVVHEQLDTLFNSGLNGLHVTLLGTSSDLHIFTNIASSKGISFNIEFHSTNLELFEIPAMRFLQNWAYENQNGYVLYFHTKGVSAPQNVLKKKWRELMMFWVVTNWRNNCELLHRGYEVVGVNWRNIDPISHFPGNFFMAQSRYIMTLQDFGIYYANPKHSDGPNYYRVGAEFWIGSSTRQPRVFSHVSWNEIIDRLPFWENRPHT